MSNEKTNKERLQDNNNDLQEIKTTINNLPEYQDIIPIYGSKGFDLVDTFQVTNQQCQLSSIDNYYLIRSTSQIYIGEINSDKSYTNLYTGTISGSYNNYIAFLVDYDDTYIYFFMGGSWNSDRTSYQTIYKLDKQTKEVSNALSYTLPNPMTASSATRINKNFILYSSYISNSSTSTALVEFDLKNNTYNTYIVGSKMLYWRYTLNSTKLTDSGSSSSYLVDTLTKQMISLNGKIKFIDKTSSRIIINNDLYELNSDLTLGELLQENIFDKSDVLVHLFGDYYVLVNSNKIYTFDYENSNLTEYATMPSNCTYNGGFVFNISNNILQLYLDKTDTNTILGYNIAHNDYYTNVNHYLSSNYIKSGTVVYDENHNPISGTMPNNGALNYTPSTSQQNIPAGYTTGGTISAVTSAIDNNIVAENIKKDVEILGVTGTLEGTATPNIFLQDTEPTEKNGIWIESDDYEIENIVSVDRVNTEPTWITTGISPVPYNCSSAGVVNIDTDIYFFGSRQSGYYTTAYKYDTLTNTYTQLTDIPYEFNGGSAVAVGTTIYLFGGWTGDRNTVYKYDILTDTYTQLSNIPMSFYSNTAVRVGDYIYLLGNGNSKAYKYNYKTDTYTQIAYTPYYYQNTGIVAIGTNIYTFGGTDTSSNLQKAYKYDTLTDIYTQVSSIPFSFMSGSAIGVNNMVYLFGGSQAYTTAYKYDTLTDTYTKLPDIPNGISSTPVAVVGDKAIYLMNNSKAQVLDLGILDFEDNTFVISQALPTYKTQIYSNESNIRNGFDNAWFYTTQDGLITDIPSYYGDGTSWVKFKN